MNPVESLVGIRDADEFRLTSVDAAAECPASVRGLAVVDIAVLAEPAFAAEGLDIDRHPVPRLYRMDLFPYLGDYSYHLVADGDARNCTWHAVWFLVYSRMRILRLAVPLPIVSASKVR